MSPAPFPIGDSHHFLPWLGAALVPALLVASMAALPRLRVSPEARRKLLHVEMALVALAFPFLFASAWPVLGIAAAALAWLAVVRRLSAWRARFGGALHAVGRDSAGELWFVAGVCASFLWAGSQPAAYAVALLVLGLADAAAALVGRRWGWPLRLPGGTRKSAAGCGAFFVVAFAVTAGVLYAAGDPAAMRSALLVALSTTLIEALLGRGLDNLFVPLGALAALELAHGLP